MQERNLLLDLLRDIPGVRVHDQPGKEHIITKVPPIPYLKLDDIFTGVCRQLAEQGVEWEESPPKVKRMKKAAKVQTIRSIAGHELRQRIHLWMDVLSSEERKVATERALHDLLYGRGEEEDEEVFDPPVLERLIIAGLSRFPFVQQRVLR